jgi:hypothetical protein
MDDARKDDHAFFARWPDREYRLRRAWPCEMTGEAPAGFAAFTIVHRHVVDMPHRWKIFDAPIALETNRSDAEIRQIVDALSHDAGAMLRGTQ